MAPFVGGTSPKLAAMFLYFDLVKGTAPEKIVPDKTLSDGEGPRSTNH